MYYQIAIHGRDEIDLAPDEYAGFTMTLLRMLAFAPAKGGLRTTTSASKEQAVPVSKAGVAASRVPSAAKVEVSEPVPALAMPPVVEQPAARFAVGAPLPDWMTLLSQLRVQGLAGELAKNSVLDSYTDGVLTLSLSPEHKSLQSNKVAFERLQSVLSEYFAQPVKLQVVLGKASVATPAVVAQQVKQDRQEQANEAIAADGFVLAAQAELEARVIPDSIRPL